MKKYKYAFIIVLIILSVFLTGCQLFEKKTTPANDNGISSIANQQITQKATEVDLKSATWADLGESTDNKKITYLYYQYLEKNNLVQCEGQYFANTDCQTALFNLLIYQYKLNPKTVFDDVDDPISKEFYKLMIKNEGTINQDTQDKTLLSFKEGKPDSTCIVCNAVIAKDESYCNNIKEDEKKLICKDEVKFMKAESLGQCSKISSFDLYVLCNKQFNPDFVSFLEQKFKKN